MQTLADGGLPQKVLALRRELEIDVMQAVSVQQVVCENIYRAGTSGPVRTPVRPSWIAGSGSAGVPGTASPAIKWPSGVNPRRGEGRQPLIRTCGAREAVSFGSGAGTAKEFKESGKSDQS